MDKDKMDDGDDVEVLEVVTKVNEEIVKENYKVWLEETGDGDNSANEDVFDEEHDVVEIESDDEEQRIRIKEPSKDMICFRCPNKKNAIFRNKEMYLFHIKRHVVQGQFACPTCRRPFTKITHCASHEIRVHGTQIEFFQKDPVVAYARKYLEEKNRKKEEREQKGPEVVDIADSDDENEEAMKVDSDMCRNKKHVATAPFFRNVDAYETDPEDVSFYENKVSTSNSCRHYVGPEVTHMVESYEIQLYHAGRKYRRGNHIAKLALNAHKRNFKKGHDVWRLGRFSGNNAKKPRPANKMSKGTVQGQNETAKDAGPPRAQQNGPDSSAATTAKTSNGKLKSTKLEKDKRDELLSTSSSSSEIETDNSSDEDYEPPSLKTKKKSVKKAESPLKKKHNQKMIHRGPSKLAFPPEIMTARMCQKCSYVWSTDQDLRTHRDALHPNVPLIELMAVKVPDRQKKRQDEDDETDTDSSSSDDDLFYATIKQIPKRKSNDVKKPNEGSGHNQGTAGTSSASSESNLAQTEKEKFLEALGLISKEKLRSMKPKPSWNLKPCKVLIERLSDSEVRLYTGHSTSNRK